MKLLLSVLAAGAGVLLLSAKREREEHEDPPSKPAKRYRYKGRISRWDVQPGIPAKRYPNQVIMSKVLAEYPDAKLVGETDEYLQLHLTSTEKAKPGHDLAVPWSQNELRFIEVLKVI